MKKREINEERQTRLVNLCRRLHIDKIRLTVYSSFVKVSYITCMDCECREVDEVKEERLRQWRERDRHERERN